MKTVMEWLAMGGYAWYVWPSYAAGLLILVLNAWLPLRYHRQLLNRRTRDGR